MPTTRNSIPRRRSGAIREFIESAEALPGPPVGELAGLVAGVIREAWDRVEGIMSGQRHRKVLAVQLLLSRQAREQTPDDPEQRRLFAASTLLSGMIATPPVRRG